MPRLIVRLQDYVMKVKLDPLEKVVQQKWQQLIEKTTIHKNETIIIIW